METDYRQPNRTRKEAAEEKRKKRQILERHRDLVYAEVFGGPQGQEALADLKKRFAHDRPRFIINEQTGQIDTLQAAIIDGEQNVMRWIDQRIETGGNLKRPD